MAGDAYGSQRVRLRQGYDVHLCFDASVGPHSTAADLLQHLTALERLSRGSGHEITERMLLDPLGVKRHAEGFPHQDGKFVRRIVPVDVCARISFGKAKLLRLRERLLEAPAFAEAAQQVIARAIHHALDGYDRSVQSPQRLQHRRPATDRCREADCSPMSNRGRV